MDQVTSKKPHPPAPIKDNPGIIFTKSRNDPFARVPKDFLDIPKLSYKAKGIASRLFGKPPGWIIQMEDLINHGRESRFAIQRGLKELSEHGYATLTKDRDALGRIRSTWRISDAPMWAESGESPETGFPSPVNPLLSKNDSNKRRKRRKPVISPDPEIHRQIELVRISPEIYDPQLKDFVKYGDEPMENVKF